MSTSGEGRGSVTAELFEVGKRRAKKRARRCCFVSVAVAVCLVTLFVVVVVSVSVAVGVTGATEAVQLPSDPHERAVALLERYPVIDGLVITHTRAARGSKNKARRRSLPYILY